MEPVRILEYITSRSLGGAEHGVQIEARELSRRGHQILFASPAGRRLTEELTRSSFEVWSPRTHGKADPLTFLRLVKLIRERGIQVVHTHLSTASLLGGLAARACGVPAVATVHGLNSATCYRRSTRVVAVSHAVERHLLNQGMSPDRIRVVHNGIETGTYRELPSREEARQALQLGPEDPVLMYAGRLSPEKGASLLPAILSRVQEVLPRARLLVLGEGSLRRELEPAQCGELAPALHLLGFQSDLRPFFAAADCLLLPSYREGLPRVLLEAMAAGLPAVGTDAGGIPEAIVQGETGRMASIGDVEGLAEACIELLSRPSVARQMGCAAQARARQYFSVVTTITRLEAVFEEALSELRRAPSAS